MRKQLLVLGAGMLQCVALEKARARNIETWVVDRDATAPGVKLADHFVSISTTDQQAVVGLARSIPADGVMTLATDMPMRSVGRCVDELGLSGPSYASTQRATDKLAMVQAFKRCHVPHPEFLSTAEADWSKKAERILDACGGLIVKPLDSSGSRGVSLVEEATELSHAVHYASKYSGTSGVLIEEFMRGTEVSVEMLIDHSGHAQVVTITDKVTTGSPHFTELGHTQPSLLPEETAAEVAACAKRAAQALELRSCAGHAEVMVTESGPKMVEIGARLGGDFIGTHMAELSTGIDMVNAVISLALGQELPRVEKRKNCGVAARFTALGRGVIAAISGVENARHVPGVVHAGSFAHIGQIAQGTSNSLERGAYVISQAQTPRQAWDIAGQSLDQISIVYEH